nr:hypothetical protein Iba_chr07dCG12600 [Ipomoea batatas]
MGATSKKTPLLFILVLLIITFLFTFPCTAQPGRDSAVPMSGLRCPWSSPPGGSETPDRPPGGGGVVALRDITVEELMLELGQLLDVGRLVFVDFGH